MATKSIQTKSRKNVAAVPISGPVKATQSFGLNTIRDLNQVAVLRPNELSRAVDHTNVNPQSVVRPASCDARRTCDSSHGFRKVKRGSSLSSSVPRFTPLDTVSSNFYLNGTWPRVGHVQHTLLHQAEDSVDIDNETQTPKDWRAERLLSSPGAFVSHTYHKTPDDLKEIRARLRITKESGSLRSSPVLPFVVTSLASGSPAKNSTTGIKHHRHRHRKHSVPHSRGSLEGLNQELETLGIACISASESDKHDGRRAPVLDLLTFELETDAFKQATPCHEGLTSQFESSNCEFSSAIGHLSPVVDLVAPSFSRDKLEDTQLMEEYGVSPPKFILTRLPPEGCENVVCKLNESSDCVQMEIEPVDFESMVIMKPVSSKCHIPSESSAFYSPLFKKYLSQATNMLADMTTVHERVHCVKKSD